MNNLFFIRNVTFIFQHPTFSAKTGSGSRLKLLLFKKSLLFDTSILVVKYRANFDTNFRGKNDE